jgi:hypothetical protein
MTSTTQTRNQHSTSPMRTRARTAGLLYIATFVFSVPAAFGFYDAVLNNPRFVLGAGSASGVPWGAMFEVITALTGIGTAVVLYPVVKRYRQNNAIGFVASRIVEAGMIMVGVVALLAVYTLRQGQGQGHADPSSVTAVSSALVAMHNWTFLLGPGVMPAINAVCLATALYKLRLVPRIIPTVGLVGAPILLGSAVATLFGAWDQVSAQAALFTLPIAAWELSIGIYMTVKGFRPSGGENDPNADSLSAPRELVGSVA